MAYESTGRLQAVAALRHLLIAGETYRLTAAAHFRLGIAETHALSHLQAEGPLGQSELGKRLGLTSGGVTHLVDRLEESGKAERRADPLRRRRFLIQLTAEGEAVFNESRQRLLDAFEGVDCEDYALLAAQLGRLAEGLVDQAALMEALPATDPSPE